MKKIQYNFIQTVSQTVSQACSCCLMPDLPDPLSSSPVHPTSHSDSLLPLSLSQPQSAIQPLSSSLSAPSPPMQTSFPAPGCNAVTCLPAQWDRPCSNVFVRWRDYKETACQRQAAAVSYSSQQFGGTTAGCRGGEVVRRPCCCSQAGPSRGPRPGRIRPLLPLWTQGLLGSCMD